VLLAGGEAGQDLRTQQGVGGLLSHGVQLKALHPVTRLRAMLTSQELAAALRATCSAEATQILIQGLLNSALDSVAYFSPSHYWAIPLLFDGCPLIKRRLLECNLDACVDPLLVFGADASRIDPAELVDFLKPPVIGYAG
jgi:hypothetical protein